MSLLSWFKNKERVKRWELRRALKKISRESPERLRDVAFLRDRLLPAVGLADDDLSQYPQFLHRHCGHGVRLWQFPIQFAPYLSLLSHLPIKSYLEIGVKHGGSFAVTMTYLSQFQSVENSGAVDLYESGNALRVFDEFAQSNYLVANSRSGKFQEFLKEHQNFDLIFIDGDHSEEGARHDFETTRPHGKAFVFHDVVSCVCPGVTQVWAEAKRTPGYHFFEFVDQYGSENADPYMGIGVMVPVDMLHLDDLPASLVQHVCT